MMTEGESEQFSLRWNNFHSNLTSGFHALLQGEDLVDVTLAAGGQFVQAHKIVLSVCSPYFKELFKVNPCKHPIVILKDVCHKELVAILQFMYQGEVNVRQEELATFLKTAEMLQIKGLTGDDSPSEAESTCSIPTPQASSRQRAPRRMVEKQLRNTPDKAVPLVETVIAEPEEAPTPPPKRLRPEVPSPVSTSSPLVTEEHSSVEMDIRNPKQEPVDYDPDIEEVERIHSRDISRKWKGYIAETILWHNSWAGRVVMPSRTHRKDHQYFPAFRLRPMTLDFKKAAKKERNWKKYLDKWEEEPTKSDEKKEASDPWRGILLQLPGRKQKDCCVCSERPFGGKRRRSKTMCAGCKRGVHRTCATMHVCILRNDYFLGDGNGLQFIETSKGRALLTQNGYIYRMNRQSGNKRFWICSEYKKDGCRARCVTVGNQMTRDASSHNHSPREDKIRVKLELARLWSSLKLVQPSCRGRYQLVHNGFIYNTDRQTERRIFWRCSEYQRIGCRGRVVSVGDVVEVKCSTHNHESQDSKIREKEAWAKINERVLWAKNAQSNQQIIEQKEKLTKFYLEFRLSPVVIVETKRGTLQLIHDNYIFYRENKKGDKMMWRCSGYHRTRCLARCHTFSGALTYSLFLHNHGPNSSMQFVRNRRGFLTLIVEGYCFIKNNTYGEKINWRCSLYNKIRCLARCQTLDDKLTHSMLKHNHPPPHIYNLIKKVVIIIIIVILRMFVLTIKKYWLPKNYKFYDDTYSKAYKVRYESFRTEEEEPHLRPEDALEVQNVPQSAVPCSLPNVEQQTDSRHVRAQPSSSAFPPRPLKMLRNVIPSREMSFVVTNFCLVVIFIHQFLSDLDFDMFKWKLLRLFVDVLQGRGFGNPVSATTDGTCFMLRNFNKYNVGSEVQFVRTKQGKIQLLLDGFYFYKCNEYNRKITWRCCMYERCRCPARCHSMDGRIVSCFDNHNHMRPVKNTGPLRVRFVQILRKGDASVQHAETYLRSTSTEPAAGSVSVLPEGIQDCQQPSESQFSLSSRCYKKGQNGRHNIFPLAGPPPIDNKISYNNFIVNCFCDFEMFTPVIFAIKVMPIIIVGEYGFNEQIIERL
ncbi:hypothetical protein C0J52_05500 [Blattella germanica]|nr:hypothetical protein C0J52_05500 [Blattella germanica]